MRRDTNVHRLAALGMDPTELLRTINGKVVATKQVITGNSDPSHLQKLAGEIKKDLG